LAAELVASAGSSDARPVEAALPGAQQAGQHRLDNVRAEARIDGCQLAQRVAHRETGSGEPGINGVRRERVGGGKLKRGLLV
jgi:hypothetical protein